MSYYVAKGVPWRYKGVTDVTDCKTSEDVIAKAHLDWEVDKCELYGKMSVNINSDEDLDKVIEKIFSGFVLMLILPIVLIIIFLLELLRENIHRFKTKKRLSFLMMP